MPMCCDPGAPLGSVALSFRPFVDGSYLCNRGLSTRQGRAGEAVLLRAPLLSPCCLRRLVPISGPRGARPPVAPRQPAGFLQRWSRSGDNGSEQHRRSPGILCRHRFRRGRRTGSGTGAHCPSRRCGNPTGGAAGLTKRGEPGRPTSTPHRPAPRQPGLRLDARRRTERPSPTLDGCDQHSPDLAPARSCRGAQHLPSGESCSGRR